jgi:glycosyltransferase involved in cell wall biosynthesis
MTKPTSSLIQKPLRVGIVVPHIFMHRDILPQVIFSPGTLAFDLADGLTNLGAEVTLFSPGPVDTLANNVTADLSYFEQELAGRGDGYLDLLKKHPFTFVTLARQVQAEIIAKAYSMANRDDLDVVHIYTNEEDTALPFAKLCVKPVVFTHHDPFNFLVKYKNVFPKYAELHWLSISLAQRQGMPASTNWVGNIYHGISDDVFKPVSTPSDDYVAYFGRIVKPKGVHLAIAAVKAHNKLHPGNKLRLKIAGKHYAGKKDVYWQTTIAPQIDGIEIDYVGFLSDDNDKQAFLGNAKALIIPSTFAEPFGMVMIEALACGTPLIGLDSGAISEVIRPNHNGLLIAKDENEDVMTRNLAAAIAQIEKITRQACRQDFEARFTLTRMCQEHLDVYHQLAA